MTVQLTAKNIDDFSQIEEGLDCFKDPVTFGVMGHKPQVLPCGHTFEEDTIQKVF